MCVSTQKRRCIISRVRISSSVYCKRSVLGIVVSGIDAVFELYHHKTTVQQETHAFDKWAELIVNKDVYYGHSIQRCQNPCKGLLVIGLFRQ